MQKSHSIPRIGVLISGSGSNLQAIIDHQKLHPNLYEIALVISNKADAYGLVRAENANIPTRVIDHTQYNDRETFDAKLQQSLVKAKVDFIVLAGFMRILSKEFTQHFLGRMINIHPSLLPKYTGLETHQRALDAGDKEHGLSIHFVTPELDSGPVILQAVVKIDPNETQASLKEKVHQQEHIAYPVVIEWLAQGRLSFKDNQAWLDQKALKQPQLLSKTIS
ncbi:MAG: phosphoribosylglycinamide formyltransferase [Pseudomonadota bacterium]